MLFRGISFDRASERTESEQHPSMRKPTAICSCAGLQ